MKIGRFNMKTLGLRALSAAVLIPVVLWAIWTGKNSFAAMLVFAAVLSLHEWRMMAVKLPRSGLIMALGILYVAVSYTSYYLLREWFGFELTMACMVLVWASDSGAYFTGKIMGGSKLAEKISPNKTWAGLYGAVLTPAVMFVSGLFIVDLSSPSIEFEWFIYLLSLVIGALMGVIGQGGDLLISLMKRKSGVKDTGKLIPGHGGALDRIDSLMPNAIFFFLVALIMRAL